jgi:DNA-binding PadR family transcriptional regulator
MVLLTLQNTRGMRYAEIVREISKMTKGRIKIAHRDVWHSIRRLGRNRWVLATRTNNPRVKRFRCASGGGSYLKSELSRWKTLIEAIDSVVQAKNFVRSIDP